MSNQRSGTVYKIFEKDWNGKTLRSIKLDGDATYYGCGTKVPPCKAGDVIEFNAVQKGKYWNAELNSITVTGSGAAPQASSSGGGSARDNYWDKKDEYDKKVKQPIIQYQAATKDAIQLVVAALNNGILPTAGNKKQDKWDSFIDLVHQVRDDIYIQYTTAATNLEEGKPVVNPEILESEPSPDEWEDS